MSTVTLTSCSFSLVLAFSSYQEAGSDLEKEVGDMSMGIEMNECFNFPVEGVYRQEALFEPNAN